MTTLYENEYQVRSVISRYHREAAEANQPGPTADRRDGVVTSVAGGIIHTLRRLIHGTGTEARRAPTPGVKAGSPAAILHFPK